MSECQPTERENLNRMLKWPLKAKVWHAKQRIKEFYDFMDGQVYVSFSGGKDSTVLLHLVRSMYPEVRGMFLNTGLEYPEIKDFVKKFDNIDWIKPKKTFYEIITTYGFPAISKEQAQYIDQYRNAKSEKTKEKRWNGENGSYKISEKWKFLVNKPYKISDKCCNYMKKEPAKRYEKETKTKPIIGTMVYESRLRKNSYIRHGCNILEGERPQGRPLSIWTEENIWEYIKDYEIPYSEIYNKGMERTGCMFCLFGIQYEKCPNRLQKLEGIHPKLHKYIIEKLGAKEILDDLGVPYEKDDGDFHFKKPQ